ESNATPFFQTIKATAAILRASVSRAISARMPFCFNLSRNGLYGSCKLPPVAAEMNTSFKRRLQLWFKPRVATGFRRRTTRPAVISYSELMWVDDRQANIAAELTLGSKTMRRVYCSNNESTAYWPHLRNRSQQTHGSVSSAFGQHRLLRLPPQRLELIQLFIQPRGPLAYSCVCQ